MPSLSDLIERRVPHYLAIYLAAGWGMIGFASRALRNLGQPAAALRAVELHLRTSPYNVESGMEAARINLLLGDTAAAREQLQRAATVLDGADPGYRLAADLRALVAEIGA